MSEFAQLDPFRLETLTEVVTKYKKPTFRGRELFSQVKGVRGRFAKWDVVSNTRKTGAFNVYGSASLPSPQLARSQDSAECLYFSEHIFIGPDDLMRRRDGTWDEPAIGEGVASDLMGPATRCDYLQEWSMWTVLTTHGLSYSGGNAGAPIISVSFPVPSTHQVTPGTVWTSASTCTPWSDIDTWCSLVESDSNYPLDQVWMNRYTNRLIVNAVIAQGANLDQEVVREARQNGVVTRLAGRDIVVYDASYVDSSGTKHRFIPDGYVIGAVPDGLRYIEGSQPVPTDPSADDSSVEERRGRVSWSVTSKDPVGIKVIVSDVWIPVIVDANAVFRAIVT